MIATAPDARRINFQWMEPQRQLRVQGGPGRGAAPGPEFGGGRHRPQHGDLRHHRHPGARQHLPRQRRGAPGGRPDLVIDTLRTLQLPLPNGRSVPLNQIATFDYTQEYPLVWRRDRVPMLTVQADVAPGVLPETVISQLQPAIDKAVGRTGARLSHRARRDRRGKRPIPRLGFCRGSVHAALGADHPDVPAAQLSAAWDCLKRRAAGLDRRCRGVADLGTAARLCRNPGVLALVGMIAKNAVILIEQIEAERRAGMAVRDAVVEASASRFRPILLTAPRPCWADPDRVRRSSGGRWRSPSWAGYWSPRC